MNDLYPDLFALRAWGPMTNEFSLGSLPPDELISNVSVVPFFDDKLVVLRLENGRYEVPGGTREPNEPWIDTLRRELVEEAGAELKSFSPIGSWKWTTTAAHPYRPHLPHPVGYRVVGFGEISITGVPTNPDDGERVAEVEVLSLSDAMARFLAGNRPDLADLYRLANRIRGGR